jgi:hypothetical protein
MSDSNEVKFIYFVNDTDLPLMIDSWVDGSNALECIRIAPREKRLIHSSVGEWHMNAMLPLEDRKLWDNHEKLKKVTLIGKFRSRPCASGNYSWLDWDNLFDCVYTKLDEPANGAKGIMTFSFHL